MFNAEQNGDRAVTLLYGLPSWELTYSGPSPNIIEAKFPFPKVGYVSPLDDNSWFVHLPGIGINDWVGHLDVLGCQLSLRNQLGSEIVLKSLSFPKEQWSIAAHKGLPCQYRIYS